MSKAYGRMVSFDDAVRWVESIEVPKESEETKAYVLHRLEYERDQNIPVKPRIRKGRTFDEAMCGNCSRCIEVIDRYCPGCGVAIDWRRGNGD